MALFQPGNKGRPKGIKNKPSMQSLKQSLAAKAFDLGDELVKIIKDPKTDQATRLNALKLIAQYTQTIPKDDEPSPDSLNQLSLEELDELINELENPPASTEDQAAEATSSLLDGGKTELEAPQRPAPHLQPDKALS